jgi:hypothetical protein
VRLQEVLCQPSDRRGFIVWEGREGAVWCRDCWTRVAVWNVGVVVAVPEVDTGWGRSPARRLHFLR